MVSPAVAVAATTSAADSILVAAKENGPPAAGMAAKSSAADSNFPCSKEEWPASKTGLLLHRFLISGPDLGIAAGFCPEMSSSVQ